MENRDLIEWAQRLYRGIVEANVPAAQLRDVAVAIRTRKPWSELSPDVKLAVMKMTVRCTPDGSDPEPIIDLPPEAVRDAANDTGDSAAKRKGEPEAA